MAITVVASDGNNVPVYDLAQTFVFSGLDISTISVQYPRTATPDRAGGLITYVQTFTFSGSNISNISDWVAQS